jgi:two-component system, NarL family, sensor histidine kinase DesK
MPCNQSSHDILEIRDRPWAARIFGAIWIINLAPVLFALIDRSQRDFDLWPILGWIGLVSFVVIYVGLIMFGVPHWVPRTPRNVQVNRVAVAAMTVIIAGFCVAWANQGFEYYIIYPAVVAGMYFKRREAGRWLAVLSSMFISLTFQHGQFDDLVQGLLLIIGLGFNSIFWTALLEQNRQLRRARAEIARLAVADERLRIARDMHDLLGHSLSLIALKSELAGRLLPDYPGRAASEIHDIEEVARTSLQEVREAVAGYRTKSLTNEIESAGQILDAAGITLRQSIDLPDLAPPIDQTLGWFVREGVTNVIRHSGAKQVRISLLEHRGTIIAEIEDDGRAGNDNGNEPDPASATSGSGLKGLRERIGTLGGSLTTGSLPGGGFRLHATISRNAGQDATPDHTPEPVTPGLEKQVAAV